MVVSAAQGWVQESVTKSIDLGGSVSISTSVIEAAPAGDFVAGDGANVPFLLYYSRTEANGLSYVRASVRAAADAPDTRKESVPAEATVLGTLPDDPDTIAYEVLLPRSLIGPREPITMRIATGFLHQAEPLPREVPQGEPQYLTWTGDIALRSPYTTRSGTVVVRTPSLKILSYTETDQVSRSGRSITYGPYKEVPVHTGATPVLTGRVHYEYQKAVAAFVRFDRHVEVSHWGDNMATADSILLRNDGAKLKGHFNRASYMQRMMVHQMPDTPGILHVLPYMVPGAAEDVYYVDSVGNVSTSEFGPAPHRGTLPRRLDLRPRYPLLGGWNYSFTVGWNEPLESQGIARRVSAAGALRVRVAVPFLAAPNGVAVDHARLRVVLPEGAADVSVSLPFEMDSEEIINYPLYLDTIGRTAVVLERAKCTSRHQGIVYIDYSLPLLQHLRKPLAVSVAALLVFAAAFLLRRQLEE
ncbi:dolichyl-diphosphooligosaccharide--protein glycosyltransferase subunit 1 [Malassezia sp. CBS 17886]|nr:dolichyl-diphosphooligosaccharide--protein glycosyltransferase subunit 1 [Malassezia sp. CBS 17886]